MSRPVPSFASKDALAINQMFEKISRHYDRLNTVLTLGMHHRWKRRLVRWANPKPDSKVLDVATGTGDIAFRFERAGAGKVTGVDPCKPLLEIANEKKMKMDSCIEFLQGDALNLPFNSESFDIVSISFGLRNLANPEKGCREMHRVLKTGGTLVILESGAPESQYLYRIWSLLFRCFLEPLGNRLSGSDAYTYLRKSSETFPYGTYLTAEISKLGLFTDIEYRPVLGQSCYLYKMKKT